MVFRRPKCILGEFGTFLKNKKISKIFHHVLDIFCKGFEIFSPKWARNDQIWAKSGVWKTLKNPNFEEILIFEGCGGSRMTKMHSGGV